VTVSREKNNSGNQKNKERKKGNEKGVSHRAKRAKGQNRTEGQRGGQKKERMPKLKRSSTLEEDPQ